jgi:hypothetical protein
VGTSCIVEVKGSSTILLHPPLSLQQATTARQHNLNIFLICIYLIFIFKRDCHEKVVDIRPCTVPKDSRNFVTNESLCVIDSKRPAAIVISNEIYEPFEAV